LCRSTRTEGLPPAMIRSMGRRSILPSGQYVQLKLGRRRRGEYSEWRMTRPGNRDSMGVPTVDCHDGGWP
jgi:hypothetical protein